MDEELNQKISQLIDNELSHEEALSLLQLMRKQPQLQDKMSRYEAISHAVKAEAFVPTRSDFAERVRQQIQSEPAYLLPQHKTSRRNYKIFALAASVAAVAIMVSRIPYAPDESISVPEIAMVQPQEPVPAKEAMAEPQAQEPPSVSVAFRPVDQDQFNARFNDYLQAHSESVYIDGQTNFQPYARVAAYGRE